MSFRDSWCFFLISPFEGIGYREEVKKKKGKNDILTL